MLSDVHETIECAKDVGRDKALDELLQLAESYAVWADVYPDDSDVPDLTKVITFSALYKIVDKIQHRK